ncbi:hypothetical protein IAU60_006571 [Kwoniella sp. DSM 27419]
MATSHKCPPSRQPADSFDASLPAHGPRPHAVSPGSTVSPRHAEQARTTETLQQSYLDWSQSDADSSFVHSQFTRPSTYAFSSALPADNNRSFFRLSRTTLFSDYSAPSTVPDVTDLSHLPAPFNRPTRQPPARLSSIPESPIVTESVSRSIPTVAGWDEMLSASVDGVSMERRHSAGTFGPKDRRYSTIGSVSARSGDSEANRANPFAALSTGQAASQAPGRRPRPVSMLSASDSAYSGRGLDEAAQAARKALGILPLDPKGTKAVHRSPQSERAIEEYLVRQNELNNRKIPPAKQLPVTAGALPNEVDGAIDAAHNIGLGSILGASSHEVSVPVIVTTPNQDIPHKHYRSTSIDSLPSLHPSLTDSINTLSRLLPTDQNGSGEERSISPKLLNEDMRDRDELSPAQRAILLRRTKKLEKMLGEVLPEREVGKIVDKPIAARIVNKGADTCFGMYDDKGIERSRWSPESDDPYGSGSPTGRARVKGSFTDRARNALKMDHHGLGDRSVSKSRSAPATPSEVPRMAHEHNLRDRRQQLAKLHRLLGAPIPQELIDSATPASPSHSSVKQSFQQAKSLPRTPNLSDQSFISFDDDQPGKGSNGAKWRLKLPRSRGQSNATCEQVSTIFTQDSNYFSAVPGEVDPDREGITGRWPSGRQAVQIEQPSGLYKAYDASLQSLINAADQDQLEPGETLHQHGSWQDPTKHAARRRRTGKLSHFFGEQVDLSSPPNDLAVDQTSAAPSAPGPARVPGSGRGDRARTETFDQVLMDMRKSVQNDVKVGGIYADEGERLGALMSQLKAKVQEKYEDRAGRKYRVWELI